MELSTLPEHVVVETTEHKCLQSQFSVLYNEAMQLKTQLEEARNQLQVISKTICLYFFNSANFMGHDSEFMESFLKASAQTKRTDTGVTKIQEFFVMYIFGVPHTLF